MIKCYKKSYNNDVVLIRDGENANISLFFVYMKYIIYWNKTYAVVW